MQQAEAPAPARVKAADPLRLRLAFGAVLWRVGFLVFILGELGLWRIAKANVLRGRRLAFMIYYTPRIAFAALLFGGLVAILADLLVRLVVQPMARLWYNPRADVEQGSFHLASDESIDAAWPARRAVGRRWQSGTLVRTNRRLWFFPLAWDAEPWAMPVGDVSHAEPVPSPRLAWGFISGLPDRIALGANPEMAEVFSVREPDEVLGTFAPPGGAPARGPS